MSADGAANRGSHSGPHCLLIARREAVFSAGFANRPSRDKCGHTLAPLRHYRWLDRWINRAILPDTSRVPLESPDAFARFCRR